MYSTFFLQSYFQNLLFYVCIHINTFPFLPLQAMWHKYSLQTDVYWWFYVYGLRFLVVRMWESDFRYFHTDFLKIRIPDISLISRIREYFFLYVSNTRFYSSEFVSVPNIKTNAPLLFNLHLYYQFFVLFCWPLRCALL